MERLATFFQAITDALYRWQSRRKVPWSTCAWNPKWAAQRQCERNLAAMLKEQSRLYCELAMKQYQAHYEAQMRESAMWRRKAAEHRAQMARIHDQRKQS